MGATIPRPATLSKKRLNRRYFPVNFAKFLRTPFYKEHPWWLLLQAPSDISQMLVSTKYLKNNTGKGVHV